MNDNNPNMPDQELKSLDDALFEKHGWVSDVPGEITIDLMNGEEGSGYIYFGPLTQVDDIPDALFENPILLAMIRANLLAASNMIDRAENDYWRKKGPRPLRNRYDQPTRRSRYAED